MDQLLFFAGNHPVLFAALGAVVVAIVANEVHGTLRGDRRLPPLEAVRLINDSNALVVDVRPAVDFKRGHILNSVNVPLAKIKDDAAALGKDKARALLVYCALGSTAPVAGEQLKKLGYTSVFPLKGGLNGWQAAGLPVTTK